MTRIFNFSAGPAVLPEPVLRLAQEELFSLPEMGMSVLEISHRSDYFEELLESTTQALHQLLAIPKDFHLLFLQGGASLQFSMVALNFLDKNSRASYLDSGTWADKAIQEARKEGTVDVIWSGKPENYTRMPKAQELQIPIDTHYLHITSNETIHGVAFQSDLPDLGVPIVCDASSDIFSRPINWKHYGLIYAGAQKNIGAAGVTLAMVKDDFLATRAKGLHTMLDYGTYVKSRSLYNTPPVFGIYLVNLVAQWLLEQGGIPAMHERNLKKAALLYKQIDQYQGFYQGHAKPESRSLMNVTFRLPHPELEKAFLSEAADLQMDGLAGHRSVGGIRASIYNAFPVAGVEALATLMQDFANRHA